MDKPQITFSFDQSKVKQEVTSHKLDLTQLSETFDGTAFKIDNFVRCQLINNRLDPLKLTCLLRLMSIFAETLPNMKINQLYSYVFSSACEKLLIFYKDKLIGGLCFNSFPKKYVQIDLLAIKKEYQLLGMGTLLLNTLKRLLQIRKTHLIVTNADNNSIQFYRRNHFSQAEFISNKVWSKKNEKFGFSTKMQCIVYPNINYFTFMDKIRSQKEYLVTAMKQLFFSQNEYTCVIPNEQRRPFQYQQGNFSDYFLVNPLELEGVSESGWNWDEYKRQRVMKQTANYRLYVKAFNEIYELAEPQLKKIDSIIVESNFILCSQPMDLDTIRKRIYQNKFQNESIFWYEICHFVQNAKRLYRLNERLMNNLCILEQKIPTDRKIAYKGGSNDL